MKKKAKLVSLSMIILFLGLCTFFVFQIQEKTKESDLKINKSSESKTNKKAVTKEHAKVGSDHEQKGGILTASEEKKNIAEFKKDIISNGLYINLAGTLEPANEKNVIDIENKIKNPVIQDVEKDGMIIKVLTDSAEQTEGEKWELEK